jgi:hypothetical protein
MAIDLETVTLMSTYRVGFLPPKAGSLAAGELYIEVAPPDAPAVPRIWVGTPTYTETSGDIALLLPANSPPINLAVPAVYQEGAQMVCTMGEWVGEPTEYHYLWQLDGADAGIDDARYDIADPDDVGKTMTCTVSAVNANGSADAPRSHEAVVEAPAV